MSTTTQPPRSMQQALNNMLDEAIRRVIGGEPLSSFCAWFVAELDSALGPSDDPLAGNADYGHRLRITMARHFWRDVPMPNNRWRTQSLPKVERNDRCYCGSGRKYKQCCVDLADMPPVLNAEHALGLVLASIPPAQLSVAALRQVPPAGLAIAAMAMRDEFGDAAVAAMLEPLFLDPVGLDARHDDAFEVLMDVLISLGQETRREQLVQAVSQSSDKVLATSARCRRVSMLADRGEYAPAWALFYETQRLSPNDPQLLHLELLTLLSEGRNQEARARAPLLAARARKLGFHELAQTLTDIGLKGLVAAAELPSDDEDLDEEERSWTELLRSVPATFDEVHCRSLYVVEQLPPPDGQTESVLQLRAGKSLQAIEKRWRKAYPVAVPMMTDLDADADAILDDPQGVMDFLAKYPDAWLSVKVQDDLLLAAREITDMSGAQNLFSAARVLAAHAVAVCRAVLGDDRGKVIWGMLESRPFLRVIAQAIIFARDAHDEAATDALMRWALALNPHDNHGWREPVIGRALAMGQAEEALVWLDRYPNDMPPADHQRALAHFMLGDVVAAEAILRAAHGVVPAMVEALLPELLDAPPADEGPGMVIGGAEQAYDYRSLMRPVWVRTRALAWLQGLDLPKPKPKPKPKSRVKTRAKAAIPDAPPPAVFDPDANASGAQEKRLSLWFPDMPRLRGYLTAIAWSPGMVMPNVWMTPLMQLLQAAQDTKVEAPTLDVMNTVLGDLMQLYNHLNGLVLTHDPNRLPDDLPTNEAVFPWAAGFVQAAELCAGEWRGAGFAVKSTQMPFKTLFALAAQAAAQPDAWRATDGDGQALLTGVSPDAPVPDDVLTHALMPLWSVIVPLRQQRAKR